MTWLRYSRNTKDTKKAEVIDEMQQLLNQVPADCYVAGGTVLNALQGNLFMFNSDIDLYFPNRSEYNNVRQFFSKTKGYNLIGETSNAKRYRGPILKYKNQNPPFWTIITREIDLIHRHFYENPEDLLENYDFINSAAAVYKNELYLHPEFDECLRKGQLKLFHIDNPIATIIRIKKYKETKRLNITIDSLTKLIHTVQNIPASELVAFAEQDSILSILNISDELQNIKLNIQPKYYTQKRDIKFKHAIMSILIKKLLTL